MVLGGNAVSECEVRAPWTGRDGREVMRRSSVWTLLPVCEEVVVACLMGFVRI